MARFIGLMSILIILAALLYAGAPVQAAPPTVPISDNCVVDGTIGVLTVFYCESESGVDYLVNSFGFVVVID